MKILLDIKDSKVNFFMEVLQNFSFVKKATPISLEKSKVLMDIKEAVDELNLVKKGKLNAREAKSLIDEL